MADTTSIFTETNIETPHENDILLGRGGTSIRNEANVRYRGIVREHKKAYQTYTRYEKTNLAESLVRQWREQNNPPGRFLELDAKTSRWYCISEKSARRKTSQLLREGAPKIRRQIKEESDAKKPMTPVRPKLTASLTPLPVVKKTPTPPRKTTGRRPSRTPASKMAKAKLKKKAAAVTPAPVNINTPAAASTPQRHIAPSTRPPLLPNPNTAGTGSRMASPSPQYLQTPPQPNRENWPVPPPQHHGWQWSPYYGSTTPHMHYYPPPPPPQQSTASTQTLPLQTITPNHTNNRGNQYNNNTPVSNGRRTPTKPGPSFKTPAAFTPKPAAPAPVVERKLSFTPPPIMMERNSSISAPSPESVLDFNLIEMPISSWDEKEDGDSSLSSLVEEGQQLTPAVMTTGAGLDLSLPDLSSPRHVGDCLELKSASLSPPSLEFRKDNHPFFLDTAASSFDSFDRMESLIRSEDLDSSTLDILNELDNEMEADLFAMRPCHSF